jgi:TrmH family RNA methyltransferase
MLSKVKIREIRSLEFKKFRDERGLFVAEGNKLVADMLPAFACECIIAQASWMATQGDLPVGELILAEKGDLRRVSFLKSPREDVMAVFRKPSCSLEDANPESRLVLALDGIQDPGNLGTIIRIAGWFGIEHVVCSEDTTDIFSPKAVQATMGALTYVKVHYTGLEEYIARHSNSPVYGTFPDGENIYTERLASHGILVMGNEGSGIRPETVSLIKDRLLIPPYPPSRETVESLNVATATAIVCAEFRRVTSGY